MWLHTYAAIKVDPCEIKKLLANKNMSDAARVVDLIAISQDMGLFVKIAKLSSLWRVQVWTIIIISQDQV